MFFYLIILLSIFYHDFCTTFHASLFRWMSQSFFCIIFVHTPKSRILWYKQWLLLRGTYRLDLLFIVSIKNRYDCHLQITNVHGAMKLNDILQITLGFVSFNIWRHPISIDLIRSVTTTRTCTNYGCLDKVRRLT